MSTPFVESNYNNRDGTLFSIKLSTFSFSHTHARTHAHVHTHKLWIHPLGIVKLGSYRIQFNA